MSADNRQRAAFDELCDIVDDLVIAVRDGENISVYADSMRDRIKQARHDFETGEDA